MPTSPFAHIQTFVNYLIETRPASVLDIGLGNGKLGFIARDLLDVMLGERYRREQWQVRIDGIEIFADYIQNHQRDIYDHIYIGDAYDIIETLGSYEMILIGDVLEHFEKDKAWQFLDRCAQHTTAHLIINIPLGPEWKQPEIYGNPHECHRSVWTWPELAPFTWKYKFFELHPATYATLLIRKGDYIDHKINLLRTGTS
ncbi:MAG: class I SAM-dependent methyltransferase [Desulfobacteraceae bacterium]|nr:class I SAM-dependent methyltransferase [Desulfobacteraceae bacterium]